MNGFKILLLAQIMAIFLLIAARPEIFFNWGEEECLGDLPEGYELQINSKGNYRPARKWNHKPINWFKNEGTKCEAINHAIKQYKYEHNSEGWYSIDE